jgi:hypothetical protein
MAKALPVYRKNLIHPPVAGPENGQCSTAILLMVTALEAHLNRLTYFEPMGLSTGDNLLKKLKTYLPGRKCNRLLRETTEITACRDAIAHAHVYEENRNFDQNWKLTKRSWKVAKVTQLRGKTKRIIMKREPVSSLLRVNLMPTAINYVDAAKSLVVVVRVMRALEKRYGNPKAWVGTCPYDSIAAKAFLTTKQHNNWEDWVSGALQRMHKADLKDATKRLRLRIVHYNSSLAFAGLVP